MFWVTSFREPDSVVAVTVTACGWLNIHPEKDFESYTPSRTPVGIVDVFVTEEFDVVN